MQNSIREEIFPGISLGYDPAVRGPTLDGLTVNNFDVSGDLNVGNLFVKGTFTYNNVYASTQVQTDQLSEYNAGAGITVINTMKFTGAGTQSTNQVYNVAGTVLGGVVATIGHSSDYDNTLLYNNQAATAGGFDWSNVNGFLFKTRSNSGLQYLLADNITGMTGVVSLTNTVIGDSTFVVAGGIRFRNNLMQYCDSFGTWQTFGSGGGTYVPGNGIDITGNIISLQGTFTVNGVTSTSITCSSLNALNPSNGFVANGLIINNAPNVLGGMRVNAGTLQFYNGSAWTTLSSSSYVAGSGINITGNVIAVNQIQSLTSMSLNNMTINGISPITYATGVVVDGIVITSNGMVATGGLRMSGNAFQYYAGGWNTVGTALNAGTGINISSGNINVNSSQSLASLTVTNNVTSDLLTVSNSNNTPGQVFTVLSNSGTIDNGFQLVTARGVITDNNGDAMAQIGMRYGSTIGSAIIFNRGLSSTDSFLTFMTNTNVQMTLDNSGRLGIGVSTPVATLDVGGPSNFRGIVNINASGNATPLTIFDSNFGAGNMKALYFGQDNTTNNCVLYSFTLVSSGNATNYLGLGLPGSQNVLIINGNKRVGINNTVPTRELDVTGNTNVSGDMTSQSLTLVNNNNVANQVFATLTNSGTLDNQFQMQAARGLVSNNPGDVTAMLLMRRSSSGYNASVNFHRGTTGINGFMSFSTAQTERARIDSSGNFGIGTTSPNYTLTVQSNGSTLGSNGANIINSTPTGQATLNLASDNSFFQLMKYGSNNGTSSNITNMTNSNGLVSITGFNSASSVSSTTSFTSSGVVIDKPLNATINSTVTPFASPLGPNVELNYCSIGANGAAVNGGLQRNGSNLQYYNGTLWQNVLMSNSTPPGTLLAYIAFSVYNVSGVHMVVTSIKGTFTSALYASDNVTINGPTANTYLTWNYNHNLPANPLITFNIVSSNVVGVDNSTFWSTTLPNQGNEIDFYVFLWQAFP